MDVIDRLIGWSGPREGELVAGPPMTTAALVGGLRRRGLTAEQAGNLAARLQGLAPTPGGWRPDQIDHLLFARWLAAHHLIDG